MRFSYGKNSKDTRPVCLDMEPGEFAEWLEANRIDRPATEEHKVFHTPFIAPFLMRGGTWGKKKTNIVGFGAMFGLDIDKVWTAKELDNNFAGFWRVIYNTTKSREDNERLRVILTMDREYSFNEYLPLWHAFNRIVGGVLDPSTKNENRILYTAALWEGAHNQFIYRDGKPFSVDQLKELVSDMDFTQEANAPAVEITGSHFKPDDLATPKMIQDFQAAEEGGRFYRLLTSMAARAKREGWSLTAEELRDEALSWDQLLTGKSRKNALQEARNALGWADKNVETETSIMKMRKRLLWQAYKRDQRRKNA